VAANVLMAILADFMLVWLPAPTLALSAPKAVSGARPGPKLVDAAAAVEGCCSCCLNLTAPTQPTQPTRPSQKPNQSPPQVAKFDVLGRFFAGTPDNAFQKVQAGMQPFTLGQRFKAPLRNGMKLFCVGVGARWVEIGWRLGVGRGSWGARRLAALHQAARFQSPSLSLCHINNKTAHIPTPTPTPTPNPPSFIGVIVTNALIGLRTLLDPAFKPLNQPQNVLQTSAAYGTYMATSSNLRYQVRGAGRRQLHGTCGIHR
jgi:hypothetical protein